MSFSRLPTLLLLAALLCLGGSVSAQSRGPSVTAVLDSSETSLGNPVQLQIKVTGASNPKPPSAIEVEGLDIRYAGTSREYQMNNFSVRYSFTYNYTTMPLEAGTYTIPPLEIEAGGQQLYTPELTLTVVSSSPRSGQRGRRGRGGGPDVDVDPQQIGFIDMLIPKTTAYVGEMIPVQVRLGLNMRTPVESLGSGIQIAGQGFTTQKMPEPRQTIESLNGRHYQVFIFKTAISPVRAGTLEIGPAEINPTVRVPRGIQRNPSLPRDLFDDPFFNNFFNDPAFAPSIPREVKLRSESATLEVKPLPPNAPPTFGGAIGMFTLRAVANPTTVQVGDPITVTATLTGRGSFDRVTAPALEDASGWHTYPPSDRFRQDDDVGISGSKTFELVVAPKDAKRALPPLVFSFFDPVKETYVTLRSEEIPVQVQGGAAPAPTPAVAAAGSPPPAAAPAATPTPPQEQEILYLTDQPDRARTFTPLYEQPVFWAAQLVPFFALLGYVGWRVRQARLDDRAAQRVARLQQEASELQRSLRQNDSDARQYLAAASRAVQLKTALARNVDPNSVDAESAASAFRLDEQRRDQLRDLFARSDELRYSGNGHHGRGVSPEQRREIAELVETLRV